ncbi:MAG: carboxypeptidase regulatory-like domain-containing protein [Acidobacteria bacterium]|nr:carboxypeptidase regulatory-like domain-containing protein [Acidobacteriota bacterium]
MLRRAFLLIAALVIAAFLAAVPARAQFGSIEGDVKDQEGNPMVGAQILIERIDIKGNYKCKSDRKGHYFHGGLPLGNYTVTLADASGKTLDLVKGVRTRLGDSQMVNFDLKARQQRAAAQQAGIAPKQQAFGVGGGQELTKEQRAQIEAAMKQREAVRQKMEKLQKNYGAGMEAMKTAGDQGLLAAALNIPAGTTLTPEVRTKMDDKKFELCSSAATDFEAAAEAAKTDSNEHIVLAQLAEARVCQAKAKRGQEATDLYNKSIEAYQKAIALKADDPSYHNNYALALVNVGKMPQALEELGKAAQLDPPGAGRYFYNLGAVLTNSGRAKEATDAFKKATEADPKYADAWYQLGVSLLADVKLDQITGKSTPAPGTLEALQKYLDLQPDGAHAAEAKGMIEALAGTVQTRIKSEKAVPAKKKK